MSHNCKNLFLGCMDFRIQETIYSWLKENGYAGDIDVMTVPGSCKAIADHFDGCQAGLILGGMRLAYDKHEVRRIILTQHEDCGAYGGQSIFETPEAEKSKLLADMKKARDFLKLEKNFPKAEVKTYWLKRVGKAWEFEEVIS